MLSSLFVIFITGGLYIADASALQNFSSAFSDTEGKNCQMEFKATKETHGSDTPQTCRGVEGYRLRKSFSAVATYIEVQAAGGFSQELTKDGESLIAYGKKIEWRLVDGKPFACIIRVFCYTGESDESGNYFADRFKKGEYLLVRGLRGFEHIKYEVDVRSTKNANEAARDLADKNYKK